MTQELTHTRSGDTLRHAQSGLPSGLYLAALFYAIDVTELGPWAAMARLGLVMVQAEAVE